MHLIRQLILEILSEVKPFEWKKDKATFEVDGELFEVVFTPKTIGKMSGLRVTFYKARDENAPWMYKMTGESNPVNSVVILSTVIAVIKDYLIKRKPKTIWFTADEPSRISLYNKLINKIKLPEYDVNATDGVYTLTRNRSVFESLAIDD